MSLAAESEAKVVYKEPLFVIAEYFLWLFSLEGHRWRIIPHRDASVPQPQRMIVKFYSCTNTKESANDTPRIPVHAT